MTKIEISTNSFRFYIVGDDEYLLVMEDGKELRLKKIPFGVH